MFLAPQVLSFFPFSFVGSPRRDESVEIMDSDIFLVAASVAVNEL